MMCMRLRHRTLRSAMGIRSVILVFGCLVFLEGCASYPEVARINAFGSAAKEVTGSVKLAQVSHQRIARSVSYEEGALEYVSTAKTPFPPEPSLKEVPSEDWAARLSTTAALNEYADALAQVTSAGSSKKAADAIRRLGASAGELSKATDIPISSDLIAGVTSAVAGTANLAIANAEASRIRKIMKDADPLVAQTANLLAQDIAGLQTLATADALTWSGVRERVLRQLKMRQSSSRAELYVQYKSALADQATVDSLVATYGAMVVILPKFADAHHEVAVSSDSTRALDEFLSATDQLREGLTRIGSSVAD